ncbi:MAG TPA: bifunctional adenosylcobinamide kinase/adenosylcobinamide-phosphate guanylyltransferase [Thermoanaerobaculia bacterium]
MDVILITGGGRSGKSRHALELAGRRSRKAYVATAEPIDEEMRDRIDRHRQERGAGFLTVEEPMDLAGALRALPPEIEVAVVDCLTVWLGNLSYRARPGTDLERIGSFPEIAAFLAVLDDPPCDLVLITNELGMGIIPATAEVRAFRDLAGRVNQEAARRAGRVVLMVSGIPLAIKGGGG